MSHNTQLRQVFGGVGLPLGFGFAALLLLMLFLAAVGVIALDAAQERLDQLVQQQIGKIRIVNRMYLLARERTISLQRMIPIRDAFVRDVEIQSFLALSGEYAQLRAALVASGLSEDEQQLLAHVGELINELALPVQERVIDLLNQERPAEAQRVLVNDAIPAQDVVLERMQTLYRLVDADVTTAVQQAQHEYRVALGWLGGLAAAALLLGIAIANRVVDKVRNAARALHAEKEHAQVTLHSLAEAVLRTDRAGRVEYLNAAAEALTGWTDAEAHGRPLAEVLQVRGDTTREPIADPVVEVFAGGRDIRRTDDTVLVRRDGAERAVELTAAPVRTGDNGISGAVVVFRDVTEERALARELAYQATHDVMTGLVNRREFELQLQHGLDDARARNVQHALCYLDIDQFKTVNDTCGHLAGDELLRQLSMLLSPLVRAGDLLARIGGDEFAALLRDCDLDEAAVIAERMCESLKAYRFVWENRQVDVSASIGVVPVAADSGDLNALLRAADVACRVAKEAGRNRIHLYRSNDLVVTRRTREINWVQRLGEALDENRFVLYGQWIRPLGATRAVHPGHCEILLRLRDEGGQVVLPDAFLPAAERYQLMPAIDRWVVHAAIGMLRDLPAEGLADFGCFNINLSGQTVCDAEFLTFAARELDAAGPLTRHLCFEITETCAVTNLSNALRLISQIRLAGGRIALDDFGSGMSSFTYLKQMPVDFLKIDGAFISHVHTDATDLAMVNSINQVAHIMGLETIAEYVESQAIRDTLMNIGIDYGQGLALARPAPLAELLTELSASPRIRRGPG
jgi:diguanylate cyclase (GGDEF)-like protein/PAS domain S-box-containing protein